MSANLSKQKRDDLLSKISDIRSYIAAAPQDENTGNLLNYLSDLEKDVNGKKYGLVFEEHQETIDTVLEEHTPEKQDRRIFCVNSLTGTKIRLIYTKNSAVSKKQNS